MNRLLKITAQIVGLLILLYMVLMILLFIFVNTKDFKPFVAKSFYQMTGQKLKINGDVHLEIFPWPGINATDLILENPKGFSLTKNAPYLAKIGHLNVRLRAAALIRGNVDPANILLSKVQINIVTAKNGKTNLGALLKPKPAKQKKQTTLSSADKTDVTPVKTDNKVLNHYELPVIQIKDANLRLINLQTNKETNINKLQIVSPPSREETRRRITLSCEIIRPNPKTKLNLQLTSFVNFDKSDATVKLKKLHVILKFFELGHTLSTPVALLVRGDLSAGPDHLDALFNANFGEDAGNIQLAAKRNVDKINLALMLKSVSVTPIAEIIAGKQWLSGTISGSTSLVTTGNTLKNWIAALNGKGDFQISKGQIHDFNMEKMIIGALGNLLGGKGKAAINQQKNTAFNQISASFTINQGILSSNDFLISSPTFIAKGSGTINLPKTSIDAKLFATYANKTSWQVPLIIKGSVFKPVIRPNATSIINQLLNSKKGRKKIGNILKNVGSQLRSMF